MRLKKAEDDSKAALASRDADKRRAAEEAAKRLAEKEEQMRQALEAAGRDSSGTVARLRSEHDAAVARLKQQHEASAAEAQVRFQRPSVSRFHAPPPLMLCHCSLTFVPAEGVAEHWWLTDAQRNAAYPSH